MGGAVEAIEMGLMKARLVASNVRRSRRSSAASRSSSASTPSSKTERSPLTAGDSSIMVPSAEPRRSRSRACRHGARARDDDPSPGALAALRWRLRAVRTSWPASIEAAKAGVTTGEWARRLRPVFGEYRAHRRVGRRPGRRRPTSTPCAVRSAVSMKLGRRIKFLIGKPGLDGHSNGAEQSRRGRSTPESTSSTKVSASRHPTSSSAPRQAFTASACRFCGLGFPLARK